MNGLTARYDVGDTTVRFDYVTANGEPSKSIYLDGTNWQRIRYHPLSYGPTISLVWYQRYVR